MYRYICHIFTCTPYYTIWFIPSYCNNVLCLVLRFRLRCIWGCSLLLFKNLTLSIITLVSRHARVTSRSCHVTLVSRHARVTSRSCHVTLVSRHARVTSRSCHVTLVSRHARVTSRSCHVTLVSRHARVTSRSCHVTLVSRHARVTSRSCHVTLVSRSCHVTLVLVSLCYVSLDEVQYCNPSTPPHSLQCILYSDISQYIVTFLLQHTTYNYTYGTIKPPRNVFCIQIYRIAICTYVV